MTQQCLNHCFILHVHRQKTDNLDLKDIAQEFVQRNERRQAFLANLTIKFMCVFVFVNCIVIYWINVILGHPSNTLGPPQSTIASYSTVT